CLKTTYRPSTANRDALLSALSGSNAEERLSYACIRASFIRLPFAGRSEPVLGTSVLLGFEPQLLSHRLPVKVRVLRADLIALNLSERSQRIGDGATGGR